MSTPVPAKPLNIFDTALIQLEQQDYSREFDNQLIVLTQADVSRLFDDALIRVLQISEQTETPYIYQCTVFDTNVFYTAVFDPAGD